MLQRIQRAGQAVFLRVEAGFNAAFGDRLNPFYHLGEIAFFLFWIVVASGLYLYAFFDTGVSGAYQSVERITQGHFGVGGVMRGLHRYASDGMVVTMLLHMLRHFCFDRHRGFRWFSWVSGVVLLWLTYVSGINGYMLPWDRLAQFVVVGVAELLDWLPLFNGALIRNFVYQDSVNDRLFSLLSFIHIGVPLTLLLLLWVHVQRVPRAATNPPRAIALPLLITMVVLSLVLPVVSHAPADLGLVPSALRLDWYLLATLPLMDVWSLDGVWALLLGTTAFLLVLPWLPPKRAGADVRMTVHPGNREVPVRAGETLLEAGLRAGIPMPYQCRNGGCGVCKGTILQGEVRHAPYQSAFLSEDERMLGRALLCVCTPVTDVEVEYEDAGAERDAVTQTFEVEVLSMQRAAEEVMIVRLGLPEGARMPYRAGQYFDIVLEDGARRAFSFATAPGEIDDIEMHVRLVPGGRFTTHVFEAMKPGDRLTIEGPFGRFHLRDSARPLIFVAGATGFAPVKSMLEHAFRTDSTRQMILYWGVRHPADLYRRDLAETWAREHPNFRFVPVLSQPAPEDDWHGRTGLVHEAILQDFPDLSGFEVYTCGSVKMVETARPAFIAQGLDEDACFADAFVPTAPAPATVEDHPAASGGTPP
ncbi:MAG: cytochrome b N-terminal domain-containing protein [Burkholderiales bacterium]|nr:cytochrome b N-terminal domain-containing protein [Burkholderiales bacterium]